MKRMVLLIGLGSAMLSSAAASDWPQWRGPARDGISRETGLLKEWPQDGPALRWTANEIGTGYSTPSISNGRVFVQTTRGEEEFALAFDEKFGKKLWEMPIGKVGKNEGPQYPGTRSTPTVDGDVIYCLASAGELTCLSAADGKRVWQKHLKTDFGGKTGNWVYAESVLIDGDKLVCTPGGEAATLIALNKRTGDVIWRGPVPEGDNAEYASIMTIEAAGPKEYVQFLRKGIVGVDAATGKFLWRYGGTVEPGANILTPVVQGNRVFSSGGRSGGAVVEVNATANGAAATEVYKNQAYGAGIGGAVLIDGKLFGTNNQSMFCMEFETGKSLWGERALGPASLCYADGRLYVRSHDSGDVALVEPSGEKFVEKSRLKQPDFSKTKAWPHPVVANGALYIRDQNTLFCYDVAAPAGQ